MQKIEGKEFRMALDKGNAHFHDLHLHDCAFDNCGLSMVKYPQRMSRVQNVTLSQCRVVNSEIKPCVFEDVVVEDLSTNPILLVWAAFLRRVTLKGKIGKINLNLTPEAFCTDADRLQQFETARAAFYAETDWALDISEARLLGLRCEGVPLAPDQARSANAGDPGQARALSWAAGAGCQLRQGVSRCRQRAARLRRIRPAGHAAGRINGCAEEAA
ncbi:hypothetical protein [Achromobacter dolens]|uniref:hypothetical protein n=1 Tax=Achromobacter dolens TaxID=1287738 RepID=UPI0006C2A8E3|nr:hypothetical protein [Achromobacter dolens]CUJ77347.1 Uncharacterised protein [Achromobacter dolens]